MESLRCQGLRKSYDGVSALDDVHLRIPPSGITAIVGPNGAGKTTLLNALTGYVRLDAGHCFLGPTETTRLLPYHIVRLGVARTFQDPRLIRQLSVLDNVLLGFPDQRGETLWGLMPYLGVARQEVQNREEARRILVHVGLQEKERELAGELSYGQQKLLALACCLATQARILLLDEPVAGLDLEMVSGVLDLLQQLRHRGKAVVFIEHDIAAVRRVADHVVVMDGGKLVAQGPPAEVLERPEIVEAYLG